MDTEQLSLWGLEPFMSVDELANYLGVPKQTIYDWRVNGKGPKAHRFGKRIMFAASDVRSWVDTQRDTGPPGRR